MAEIGYTPQSEDIAMQAETLVIQVKRGCFCGEGSRRLCSKIKGKPSNTPGLLHMSPFRM
eukprot:639070-Amphidinium_carterae.1